MDDAKDSIDKVIGNYRILEEIASGGYGTVYKGEHIVFAGKIVAIKVLHARHTSAEDREHFLNEARLLEKLKHPHVLSVIDAGFDEKRFPYLISDYAPGGSLRDRLKRNKSQPLPLADALSILSQIGNGLSYAHQQNIVHRDLKPDNILFNAQGEALLADFGIATVLPTASIQYSTQVIGTPHYMAPEQFTGHVSRRSDQYALACIAYELLTGKLPFGGTDLHVLPFKHISMFPPDPLQFNPQLPPYLVQALLKALAKEREQRYPDIASFIQALHLSAQPKTRDTWLEEALAYQERAQYQDSLQAYQQVLLLDPELATTYSGMALALYSQGRSIDALERIEQALRLAPQNATFYFARGLILENLSRFTEALRSYQTALQFDPGYTEAKQKRELLLRKIQQKLL